MKNLYQRMTGDKGDSININDALNLVLRDPEAYNSLPESIQKNSDFLSDLLYQYPSFFENASKSPIEKDQEALKGIITEKIPSFQHPFEALSLAHPKIKTRDFCLEMVTINPFNIKHVPEKFLYDSQFVEAALSGDGTTVQFLPEFVTHNKDYAMLAVQSNGSCLNHFHPSISYNREVILRALDSKGFKLSQLNNPEVLCFDHEIAEKALTYDSQSLQFFTPDNPLIHDKYFAIKMIPVNAKFFSLFDENIRHDPDTLLQIVKGKTVEHILFMVRQAHRFFPHYFLLTLDSYEKCLTDKEKENNFGFYYYFHTSLFRERHKKFKTNYRRLMERKRQQEEEERRMHEPHKPTLHSTSMRQAPLVTNTPVIEEASPTHYLDKEAVITTSAPAEAQPENKENFNRVSQSYKVQNPKDLAPLDKNIQSKPADDDTDDYSHLAHLADSFDQSLEQDLSEDNIPQETVQEEAKSVNIEPTIDNGIDFVGVPVSSQQPYVPEKVQKARQQIHNPTTTHPIMVEPSLNEAIFTEEVDHREPEFDIDTDMSPAQSAARRAFNHRPINRENTTAPSGLSSRSVKRDTTKKGQISIFNFNKK